LALLLGFASVVSASQLRIDSVVQPLYLHGSESDSRISFQQVPFVTFHAAPEWAFAAISKAFVPPTDGTWKPHDINLCSRYGIVVSGGFKENNTDVLVTIDATKAVVPEGYPFTIEQVIDAVTTCVKTTYPPRPADEGTLEITVKRPAKKAAPKK
jgi:hypothetical protein